MIGEDFVLKRVRSEEAHQFTPQKTKNRVKDEGHAGMIQDTLCHGSSMR